MTTPAQEHAHARSLALGACTLDLAAGELLGADHEPVPLRRQALELLLVLGRRASQVVGKDELMAAVWPDVVVGEGSLTQTIADVRRALGDSEHRLVRNVARRGYRLVAGPRSDVPPLSLVVLPLVLEGAADDAGWFADALHGDFIIELARLQGAFVIARDTAATYAGRAVDPRQVARELGVRHVVRGRLRPEGPVLRLSLALIDGDSGVQRWTEAFVFERAELPQRLAELAIRMVRELQPELLRSVIAQRAALSPLEVTADDLAMRASAIWFRGLHADNIVEALKLLDRAVALDPNSMRGWGCIDFMLLHGLYHGWLTDRQAVLARIEEASAQIERLDQNHYYAHMARGINAFLRRDWAAMLRAATAWTAMYDHPGAHAGRGLALMLNGRPDESVEELERALRLAPRDPLVADWQYRLAFAHFMAGRLEQACEWAQTAAMSNPSLPGPPVHAAALLELGQSDAAREAWAEHLNRHPGYGEAQVLGRLPGGAPLFVETRTRLLAGLRELGSR